MRSSWGEGVLTERRATNISMAVLSTMTDRAVRPLGRKKDGEGGENTNLDVKAKDLGTSYCL